MIGVTGLMKTVSGGKASRSLRWPFLLPIREVGMSDWIKCSDRIPELRDDSVLVFSLNGGGQYGFPAGGYDMVHIEDYFGDVGDGLGSEGNQLYTKMYISAGITHWMPYPDRPTK